MSKIEQVSQCRTLTAACHSFALVAPFYRLGSEPVSSGRTLFSTKPVVITSANSSAVSSYPPPSIRRRLIGRSAAGLIERYCSVCSFVVWPMTDSLVLAQYPHPSRLQCASPPYLTPSARFWQQQALANLQSAVHWTPVCNSRLHVVQRTAVMQNHDDEGSRQNGKVCKQTVRVTANCLDGV